MEKIANKKVCRHKKGTVNGICIDCGMPVDLECIKYDSELKRALTKKELKEELEHKELLLNKNGR